MATPEQQLLALAIVDDNGSLSSAALQTIESRAQANVSASGKGVHPTTYYKMALDGLLQGNEDRYCIGEEGAKLLPEALPVAQAAREKIAADYKWIAATVLHTLKQKAPPSAREGLGFGTLLKADLALKRNNANIGVLREILGDLKDCGLLSTNVNNPRSFMPLGHNHQGHAEQYWLTGKGMEFTDILERRGPYGVFAFVDPAQSFKPEYFSLKPHVADILAGGIPSTAAHEKSGESPPVLCATATVRDLVKGSPGIHGNSK